MRRKRFQKGSIGKRKHGRVWVWVAQWREDGQKRSKVLGRCAQLPKSAAEMALAAILQPINAGVGQIARPIYTFKRFVEEAYLPFCRKEWKGSTEETTEQRIRAHLVSELGDVLMQAIQREQLQSVLERKASVLSKNVVASLRWSLNAIFRLGQSDGLIPNNPAAELIVPKRCKPGRALRPMTADQVSTYLGALELRERLIARLAIFEGVRPGEALALKREHVAGGSLRIQQRVYHGELDTPKNGKAREGALSDGTARDLRAWLDLSRDARPDAWLFPSETLETPLSRDNVWRRNMRPKLKPVGLEWATFQILRRTNASLSHEAGVDKKVSADQRGHGLGVSLEVYTTSSLKQKRAALKRLESVVTRKQKKRLSA